MIILPQKISDNPEEAVGQLETMKNAIFPFSKKWGKHVHGVK